MYIFSIDLLNYVTILSTVSLPSTYGQSVVEIRGLTVFFVAI